MKKMTKRVLSLAIACAMLFSLTLSVSAAEYVVVSGDNLTKIATMYDTTWQILAELNDLANPNLIYPNQIIQLPSTTTVETPVVEEPAVEEPTVAVTPGEASTLYVDADATGSNDGTSWANAYTDLQAALATSVAGDEIWVAEGTYYTTTTSDVTISFVMKDDVDMYGGFDGTEETLDQRDYVNNVTILSGDIGIKGDNGDNTNKVVIAANSTIDGFTITMGNTLSVDPNAPEPEFDFAQAEADSLGHLSPELVSAGDAASSDCGGGIIIWETAPVIQNCIITENFSGKGGGMYVYGLASSGELATIVNTYFVDNIAGGRGGGLCMDMNSTAVLIDCVFDGNECTAGKGGAIYNDFGCSPYIENCLFINNIAESGAAIGNDGASNPVVSNCTMINNFASEEGAGLYQGTGPFNDPVVVDTIIWSNSSEQGVESVYDWAECNPQISYSIIEHGYTGDAILDVDPQITDNETGAYSATSPAMTAGQDGGAIGFDFSLMGTRTAADCSAVVSYLVSMGGVNPPEVLDITNPSADADVTNVGAVVYVNQEATGANDGTSWADGYTDLQTAMDMANASYVQTGTEVDVWVAQGTYYTGTERSDHFSLREGVNLYGGFDGTETALEERDYEANVTILSAEIGDPTITTDNSYHVAIGADNTLIDGFVLTGGYADGADGETYDKFGGAILNYYGGNRVRPDETPTLGFDMEMANCSFLDNYAQAGGAVYSYHGANPVYTNCLFEDNSAIYGGATVDCAGTDALYTDCTFLNNSATYKGGATFVDYGAMASHYNCTFEGNSAGTAGGVVYLVDRASQANGNVTSFAIIDDTWSAMNDIFSSFYAEGCTFIGNSAGTNGGVLYVYESSYACLIDCAFGDNTAPDNDIVAKNSGRLVISGGTFTGGAMEDIITLYDTSTVTYR